MSKNRINTVPVSSPNHGETSLADAEVQERLQDEALTWVETFQDSILMQARELQSDDPTARKDALNGLTGIVAHYGAKVHEQGYNDGYAEGFISGTQVTTSRKSLDELVGRGDK